MDFQLSQTSTLEAVSNADESVVAQDIQTRVDEAAAQARASAEVAEALLGQAAAADRLARLRFAERALNLQAKQARERSDVLNQTALDELVESASTPDGKPEWKSLKDITALDGQLRFLGRALERLSEHLIPMGEIISIREESHALLAESRAMERIAQQRAEKLLGQMRDAVSEEMVLPVDLSKGVSGALLAKANALKAHAVKLSENADRLEQLYQKRA
jgi:hypothetical protein